MLSNEDNTVTPHESERGDDESEDVQEEKYDPNAGLFQVLEFDVFKRLEFNSDRKRMSVLVKDKEDGQIKLYMKGADSAIFE